MRAIALITTRALFKEKVISHRHPHTVAVVKVWDSQDIEPPCSEISEAGKGAVSLLNGVEARGAIKRAWMRGCIDDACRGHRFLVMDLSGLKDKDIYTLSETCLSPRIQEGEIEPDRH